MNDGGTPERGKPGDGRPALSIGLSLSAMAATAFVHNAVQHLRSGSDSEDVVLATIFGGLYALPFVLSFAALRTGRWRLLACAALLIAVSALSVLIIVGVHVYSKG